MKNLVAFACIAVLAAAGCSPAKFDASTPEKADESIIQMVKGMSPEEAEKFRLDCMSLAEFDMNTVQYNFSNLNGMTAEQIQSRATWIRSRGTASQQADALLNQVVGDALKQAAALNSPEALLKDASEWPGKDVLARALHDPSLGVAQLQEKGLGLSKQRFAQIQGLAFTGNIDAARAELMKEVERHRKFRAGTLKNP